MAKEIIANIEAGETRVAVMDGGVLVNLFVERSEPVAGNVYKAKVNNVLPGMEAAFVDIGLERNAFLHVADIRSTPLAGEEIDDWVAKGAIAERLRQGQEILVQVTKEPMGTKGARVTTYVALPAHYLVLMPTVNYVGVSRRINSDGERKRLRQIADRTRPDSMGVIVRTAAEGVDEKVLADDVAFLKQLWQRVQERARSSKAPSLVYQDLKLIRRIVRDQFSDDVQRMVIDSPEEFGRVADLLGSFAPHLRDRLVLHKDPDPVFDKYGVEREIDRALRRRVWLKSGGYLVLDRTEALTVIDVNTGKYVGKTDLASTILRTNLEAVGEIVRQITLRDIGGIILVDFIDMEKDDHRKKVMTALDDAVRKDRSKLHVIDLTALGLVEITRKRVYQDLEEIMRIPCPYCEGRGRVLSPETVAMRVRREVGRLKRLHAYATGMGLGRPTGIDLPAESSGFIPNAAWKQRAWKEPWYPGDTLNMAIGQGWTLTTPLQIARMLGAVANGGTLMRPVLARRMVAPDGTAVRQFGAQGTPFGIKVPRESLETMREGLRMVVSSGTGRAAAVDGLNLAGKTGSAENPRGLPHAWFAGYGPAENPQLVVVAFVEHGRRGGIAAAPIVKAVFEAAKPILGVQATGQVRP